MTKNWNEWSKMAIPPTNQEWFNKLGDSDKAIIKRWYDKLVTKSSFKNYFPAMIDYCKFVKKSPKELVDLRQTDITTEKFDEAEQTEAMVLDWLHNRLEKKISKKTGKPFAPKTINQHYSGIRGFYRHIFGKRGILNVPNYRQKDVVMTEDFVPTMEELFKIVRAEAPLRAHRIVWQAQTGQRPEDAAAIKVRDVIRELKQGHAPVIIKYLPEKDRAKNIGSRYTGLYKDGVELTKQVLEERYGRPVESLAEVDYTDDKLFVSKSGRPITEDVFDTTFKEAVKKAKVDTGGFRVRGYGLRKFYQTEMANRGIDDLLIDFTMGHSINPVKLAYWIRRREEIRERLSKANLTVVGYLNPRELREANTRAQDVVTEMLRFMKLASEQGFGKTADDYKKVKAKISYNPAVDPKPILYIIQDALAELEVVHK